MSPLQLIQERITRGPLYPWQMTVACILLNKTQGKQVEPVLWNLLKLFPGPDAICEADEQLLESLLRPLGMWRRRTMSLKHLARVWVGLEKAGVKTNGFTRVLLSMPGIGQYAYDSWRIFVEGDLSINPADSKLLEYIKWRREFNGIHSMKPRV